MRQVLSYLERNSRWVWLALGLALLNTFLLVGAIVSEKVAQNDQLEWPFYIINEGTGSFLLLPFIPALIWFFNRWPLKKSQLTSRLVLYLFVSMVFGFLYTSIMYSARLPLYKMVGITRIDEIFSDLPHRYLMEYFKQFFTFIIIYLVYWAFHQNKLSQARKKQEDLLQKELLKAQVQSLQMQLHPHFFFNTLNAISSIMYRDPNRADLLISKLSGFLRNVIGLKDQALHTLEKEVALVKQYTDVMTERYPDQLSISFSISQDCKPYSVPVLLLQPLVENAIKYAMGHKPSTSVQILAEQVEGSIIIKVVDNGPGIQEGEISHGTGLSSTMDRLKKLYQDRFSFAMHQADEGGLVVSVTVPSNV